MYIIIMYIYINTKKKFKTSFKKKKKIFLRRKSIPYIYDRLDVN